MNKEKIVIDNVAFNYDEYHIDNNVVVRRQLTNIAVKARYKDIEVSINIETDRELTTGEIRDKIIEQLSE